MMFTRAHKMIESVDKLICFVVFRVSPEGIALLRYRLIFTETNFLRFETVYSRVCPMRLVPPYAMCHSSSIMRAVAWMRDRPL